VPLENINNLTFGVSWQVKPTLNTTSSFASSRFIILEPAILVMMPKMVGENL